MLGDNGVNYWGPHRDKKLKNYLASLPISFFMIKGNHDQRPSKKQYINKRDAHPLVTGLCLVEPEFPSLLFSTMWGSYIFRVGPEDYITSFVLGGAYSADKWYRLEMQALGHSGYRWFADEQMTADEMKEAERFMMEVTNLGAPLGASHDVILSHTCPFKYIPRDMFMPVIDQSTVDDTMEHWMDGIEEKVPYKKWYCGHWHTDRTIDKMRFMYYDIKFLEA